MKVIYIKRISLLFVFYLGTIGIAQAPTYGSVEPIANPAVIDTTPLRNQTLEVREAFASKLLRCGIVDAVVTALSRTGATSTVNDLNVSFAVTAGGFMGDSNPAYGYTIIDQGPNGTSPNDIAVLTDSLGYVFSQGSVFLLDADDPSSNDFPANYVVLNFNGQPSIEESAALFELVGTIDPELFETDSSGYTQYGRAYLSLQSFVPDAQFIDGYVAAASAFGVEYTPVENGVPGLFTGGAGFPGNDWNANPAGEAYLARIPAGSHAALGMIRKYNLRSTKRILRIIDRLENRKKLSDRDFRNKLLWEIHRMPCK